MKWKLFLDDIRELPTVWKNEGNWIVCKTVYDAISEIEKNGYPIHVSFDYHLECRFNTGYTLAQHLVYESMSGKPVFNKDFTFTVHSSDSYGANKIIELLKSHLKEKNLLNSIKFNPKITIEKYEIDLGSFLPKEN